MKKKGGKKCKKRPKDPTKHTNTHRTLEDTDTRCTLAKSTGVQTSTACCPHHSLARQEEDRENWSAGGTENTKKRHHTQTNTQRHKDNRTHTTTLHRGEPPLNRIESEEENWELKIGIG